MVARSQTPQRYNPRVLRPTACWPVRTAVVGITSLGNAVQPGPMSVATPISFQDANPILERLAASLPPELAGKSASELESGWGDWVSQRNREIRAAGAGRRRLDRQLSAFRHDVHAPATCAERQIADWWPSARGRSRARPDGRPDRRYWLTSALSVKSRPDDTDDIVWYRRQ
jgi:hypothetical protein